MAVSFARYMDTAEKYLPATDSMHLGREVACSYKTARTTNRKLRCEQQRL
jgi:hypothetical protein